MFSCGSSILAVLKFGEVVLCSFILVILEFGEVVLWRKTGEPRENPFEWDENQQRSQPIYGELSVFIYLCQDLVTVEHAK